MDNNEFGKLPDNNASSNANIQGMLCTKLRNLQAAIAHIHDVLLYTLHLVAEDYGIAAGE